MKSLRDALIKRGFVESKPSKREQGDKDKKFITYSSEKAKTIPEFRKLAEAELLENPSRIKALLTHFKNNLDDNSIQFHETLRILKSILEWKPELFENEDDYKRMISSTFHSKERILGIRSRRKK